MADGEAGDRIDVGVAQRAGKGLRVKVGGYLRDERRGVEVHVHLTKPQMGNRRRDRLLGVRGHRE